MASPSASGKLLRFGLFELDPDSQQLRRAGVLLRLQPQPFKVLVLLAARHGEIVTREEIRRELWGEETFVDFEQRLNYCIRQIRTVLEDEVQAPRYIETIPRRGYRFIAPVEGLEENPQAVEADAGAISKAKIEVPTRRISWRRSWPAVAAVVVALAVVTIYVVRTRAARRLGEKDTIVIADFTNLTGDPGFDDVLKQATAIHLEQSPFLNILSDQRVAATVKLMNYSGARLTLDAAREVCVRTNSKAMLAGSIAVVGSHYLIGLRAINCQTGDTLASSEEEAENRDHVLTALDKAGNRMREKLGESLVSVKTFSKPLVQATTSSLEALKAYSRAAPSDRPEALADLKRAVQLDPNFAVAYASMGTRYENFGETALASDSFTKAFQLRDRVSERERLYIEADYYTIATGQLDKANETYLQWLNAYPKESGPYGNLAFNYIAMGEYDKALEMMRTSVAIDPYSSVWEGNMAAAYLASGRLQEAKARCYQAMAHNVDNSDLRQTLYYIAFLENDDAKMKEQIAWGTGKPGLEDWLFSAQSDTEAYHGRLAAADEMSRRAVESAKRAGAPETAAFWQANEALRMAEFGDASGAKRAATDALALNAGPSVRLTTALALARAGDVGRAGKLADALDHDFPVNTLIQWYWLPTIRAAMDLDRGNAPHATEVLQPTAPYELAQTMQFQFGTMYPVYLSGLAYLREKQSAEAAREFQKFLDHRSVVNNFPLAALANLQLGRAKAMANDIEGARNAYQRFFDLWKDADPDTPILKEAKAEHSKLKGPS